VRDIAIQQYVNHYARVNSNVNPLKAVGPRQLKNLDLMYGDLLASLPNNSKVLDLGCGTGFLLYWLSTHQGIVPLGVDGSPTQVEVAKQSLPSIDISCQDGLEYLRKHPNTFAGIFCTDVLETIPDLDLCLEWIEAARSALQPGGFFCCRVTNTANLAWGYTLGLDIMCARAFTSVSILQFLEVGSLQNCYILPTRSAHISGRLRLKIEELLHRVIFLICGKALERSFTSSICAVGFKK
ncbi:MAG: class I SAM-dependent methyltransferase, partial [Microcystaceae cyanobacterium]